MMGLELFTVRLQKLVGPCSSRVSVGRYDGFPTGHHSRGLVPTELVISEVRHLFAYIHLHNIIPSGEQHCHLTPAYAIRPAQAISTLGNDLSKLKAFSISVSSSSVVVSDSRPLAC